MSGAVVPKSQAKSLRDLSFEIFYNELVCKANHPDKVVFARTCIEQQLVGTAMTKIIRYNSLRNTLCGHENHLLFLFSGRNVFRNWMNSSNIGNMRMQSWWVRSRSPLWCSTAFWRTIYWIDCTWTSHFSILWIIHCSSLSYCTPLSSTELSDHMFLWYRGEPDRDIIKPSHSSSSPQFSFISDSAGPDQRASS